MNIRYLRKRLRYTQVELARICNVSPQSIADWESGRHAPSSSNLAKLRELEAQIPGEKKTGALPKTASIGEIVDALVALSEADRYLIVDAVNRVILKRLGVGGDQNGRPAD